MFRLAYLFLLVSEEHISNSRPIFLRFLSPNRRIMHKMSLPTSVHADAYVFAKLLKNKVGIRVKFFICQIVSYCIYAFLHLHALEQEG